MKLNNRLNYGAQEPMYVSEKTDAQNVEAIWIPLPPSGKACPYCGLKRSHLLNLVHRFPNQIRAANIRQPGVRRGRWIIHWPSLYGFIEAQATETQARLLAEAEEVE